MTSVRVLLAQRGQAGDWTEAEILLLVRAQTLAVFQHHPRHAPLRARCRSMVARGLLRFVCVDRGKIYYRAAK